MKTGLHIGRRYTCMAVLSPQFTVSGKVEVNNQLTKNEVIYIFFRSFYSLLFWPFFNNENNFFLLFSFIDARFY